MGCMALPDMWLLAVFAVARLQANGPLIVMKLPDCVC